MVFISSQVRFLIGVEHVTEKVVWAMDRIEKALNLAKNGEHGRTKVSAMVGHKAQQPQHVEYTETKVVQCSQKHLRENRIIAGMGQNEYWDAYRILRTQVLQILRARRWSTLGITSPTPGNGKSLTAINLAISLAKEVNHTVLLVDFDLRRPSIHKYFGYDPEYGVGDYILNDIPINEILFSPSIARLTVLPGYQAIADSSEMITTPKMLKLMEELKTRYPKRLVIYDLPPLLVNDDALAFSPNVDAMLLVLEEGQTQKQELVRCLEILSEVNVIGTVLNKAKDVKEGYYGYGY